MPIKPVCDVCNGIFVTEKHLQEHKSVHNRGIFESITSEKESAFLVKLRTGAGPLRSARALGIEPDLMRSYIQANPDFAQKVSTAEAEAAELIEERLFDLAHDESDYRAIDRWLTDRSPERWGKNSTINVNIVQQIESAPLLERIPKLLEVLSQRASAMSSTNEIIDAEVIELKELNRG